MKKVLFVALVLAGAWWYFVSSRTLSEERVQRFYEDMQRATLNREPQVICTLLADGFHTTGKISMGGQTGVTTADREQTCENYTKLYEQFEKIGEKMGGELHLNSHYDIHSIKLSADKKTATVDISTSLDVGGSIMNMSSRSTDTLIRRNGKVLMLSSEGTGSVGPGGVN